MYLLAKSRRYWNSFAAPVVIGIAGWGGIFDLHLRKQTALKTGILLEDFICEAQKLYSRTSTNDQFSINCIVVVMQVEVDALTVVVCADEH